MSKYFLKFIMVAGLFFCFSGEVQAMTRASDTLSRSWPGYGANHTIRFQVTADIPAGGKIVITPEVGQFTILAGFDYTDVDIATSSTENGVFVDRFLSSSSTVFFDTASTTSSAIEIILNTSFGAIGDRQIANPMAIGSYEVELETFNVSGNRIKRATLMISTALPVGMSTESESMRTSGRPVGYLSYGTTQTIMSLINNYNSTCKYDTASGTPYASMAYEFDYTGGTFHTHILNGLTNGPHTFYVRCDGLTQQGDSSTQCIYTPATGTPTEISNCIA